jgi:hypothetical protein
LRYRIIENVAHGKIPHIISFENFGSRKQSVKDRVLVKFNIR